MLPARVGWGRAHGHCWSPYFATLPDVALQCRLKVPSTTNKARELSYAALPDQHVCNHRAAARRGVSDKLHLLWMPREVPSRAGLFSTNEKFCSNHQALPLTLLHSRMAKLGYMLQKSKRRIHWSRRLYSPSANPVPSLVLLPPAKQRAELGRRPDEVARPAATPRTPWPMPSLLSNQCIMAASPAKRPALQQAAMRCVPGGGRSLAGSLTASGGQLPSDSAHAPRGAFIAARARGCVPAPPRVALGA